MYQLCVFCRAPTVKSPYNDFVIGQSNDGSSTRDLGVMTVDEIQFWSTILDESTLSELGNT